MDAAFSSQGSDTDKIDKRTFGKYVSRFIGYVAIFGLITVNLFAVSVSLQVNRKSGVFIKILSAIYAFVFGVIYILLNYYYYRVVVKGPEYARASIFFCKDNAFPLTMN